MKFVFTDEDVKGGNNFLGAGEHEVTVVSVEDMQSKAGNPMTVLEFSDSLGRSAKEYIPATAGWKVYNIAVAAGIDPKTMASGSEFDPIRLKGKKLLLVKTQTGVKMVEGKERKEYSQEYYSSRKTGAAAGQAGVDEEIPF